MYVVDILSKIIPDCWSFYAFDHPDWQKYRHSVYCDETDGKYVTITITDNESYVIRTIKLTFGKYLTKYFYLTPAQVTHSCEKLKALMTSTGTFKIIEGEDIRAAYYHRNYYKHQGTLGSSCMRYKKCQGFFDIYVDHAKMLIMTPKRGKRIMGRAILWKYGNTYLMDRVYTVEPYIELQFYAYAKEQGWIILDRNVYVGHGSCQLWRSPKSNYEIPIRLDLEIDLDKKYPRYPYMDSFCYFNKDLTKLSTTPSTFQAHTTYGGIYLI